MLAHERSPTSAGFRRRRSFFVSHKTAYFLQGDARELIQVESNNQKGVRAGTTRPFANDNQGHAQEVFVLFDPRNLTLAGLGVTIRIYEDMDGTAEEVESRDAQPWPHASYNTGSKWRLAKTITWNAGDNPLFLKYRFARDTRVTAQVSSAPPQLIPYYATVGIRTVD